MNHIKHFFIASLLMVLVVPMLSSCGPNYHLRKAKYHIQKAIQKGAEVSTDTLYKSLTVKFPEMTVDYDFKPVHPDRDTIIFEKDGVKASVILKRDKKTGQPAAVKPSVECPERVKEIKVPYAVPTEIRAGFTEWDLLIIALISAGIGMVIQYFRQRRYSR